MLIAGVPAGNITVVGASKGALIAILVSHLLKNEGVNFVILAICDPEMVAYFSEILISLYGNVLSIYDEGDDHAGSCQELVTGSDGKGIYRVEELRL